MSTKACINCGSLVYEYSKLFHNILICRTCKAEYEFDFDTNKFELQKSMKWHDATIYGMPGPNIDEGGLKILPPRISGLEISINGVVVPKVEVYRVDTNKWTLVLDRRFVIDTTKAEMDNWVWIVAYAYAIGAGYTHFGPNAKKAKPWGGQLIGVEINPDGNDDGKI